MVRERDTHKGALQKLSFQSDSAHAQGIPSEEPQQQLPTAGVGEKKSVYTKIQPTTRQTADDNKKLVGG